MLGTLSIGGVSERSSNKPCLLSSYSPSPSASTYDGPLAAPVRDARVLLLLTDHPLPLQAAQVPALTVPIRGESSVPGRRDLGEKGCDRVIRCL